jgi:hypothetical protein
MNDCFRTAIAASESYNWLKISATLSAVVLVSLAHFSMLSGPWGPE